MEQHINFETLSNYVKTVFLPASDSPINDSMESTQYHDVIDHLASCSECREQVTAISTLLEDFEHIDHQSTLTSQQQKIICDYVDGNLHADEIDRAKALIESNDDAMQAALYYQSHSEAMAMEIEIKIETPADNAHIGETIVKSDTTRSNNSFFKRAASLVNQFFSVKSPLVYTISLTAALLFVVTLVINTPEQNQYQTIIASYQDNPTIQFTEKNKLPGIGFFSQSAKISKPFEDIHIELVSDNTIKISWPEIDGAELYKMRIQVFNNDKKTVLKEKTTSDNHANFKLDVDNNRNRRYEWILYGNTIDEQMFYAAGGFIVDKGY